MSDDNNDVSPTPATLRVVSSQDEPLPFKKQKMPRPAEQGCREDDFCNHEDSEEEEEDDEEEDENEWPKFSWKAEEWSESDIKRKDLLFVAPIKMIKQQLKTYKTSGRQAIVFTASAAISPSELAHVCAEALEWRQKYSIEYLHSLISDLNNLLKSAQTKRRSICKSQKAK